MLFYRSSGNGNPVIFIHGFAHSHKYWLRVISRLPQDQFRCVAPDNLGFGRSDHPRSDYAVQAHANELVAIIKQYDHVTLVGHSMGATIAAYIAREHPELVKKLILVNPILFEDMSDARQKIYKKVPIFYKLYLSPAGVILFGIHRSRLIRLALQRATQEHVLRGIFQDYLHHSRRSLVLSLRNLILRHNLIDDIAALQQPVEIVYSLDDPFYSRQGLQVVDRLSHVTATEMPGGHKIPLKSAERLAALIAS